MLEDEIQAFISKLAPADKDYIRDLSEDKLIVLHYSLGRVLRNAFRSNAYPYLFTYCDEQQTPSTRSFDSISTVAIKLIWKYLRDHHD
jgi:hypothetical protein